MTPTLNFQTGLKCEQLYADVHCHADALHQTSASSIFCFKGPYAVSFSISQYKIC
jgi:hypothetical protein